MGSKKRQDSAAVKKALKTEIKRQDQEIKARKDLTKGKDQKGFLKFILEIFS